MAVLHATQTGGSSHSTTSYNRRAGKKKHHTHTHTHTHTHNYNVSRSTDKHEHETGACKIFSALLFLSASTLKIYFQTLCTPVCRFTSNAWFTCSKFRTRRRLGCWTHTDFLTLFGLVLKGFCGHFLYWSKQGDRYGEITQSRHLSHFFGKFHR